MSQSDIADNYEAALEKLCSLAVDRQQNLYSLPTIMEPNAATYSENVRSLPRSVPKHGWGLSEATRFLLDTVGPLLNAGQSGPRYFGFVTGGTLPSALVADWFTSLYDQNVQVHLPKETSSTVIENFAIQMITDLLSLDGKKFSGTFTTGATTSNMLALICAREETMKRSMYRKSGIADWSAAEHGSSPLTVQVFVCQAHASIRKTAALAGIGRANVIDVGKTADAEQKSSKTEDHHKWTSQSLEFDLDRLEAELRRRYEAKEPSVVVIGMGEVVTGALTDQTLSIRKLCDKYEAWLHVDAAFSAFVCLVEGYGWISSHMNTCDSITTDGHKALNVPYDCGILLVKKTKPDDEVSHACLLDEVCGPGISGGPSYLASNGDHPSEDSVDLRYIESIPSPLNRNLENSRRFRALPLYISLLSQGKEGTIAMVQRNVDFAARIRSWLDSSPLYEVLTPHCSPLDTSQASVPQKWRGHWGTTVVFFRAHPTACPVASFRDAKVGHLALIQAIKKTKRIYLSPGSLCGVGGARLAVSNWATGLNGDGDFDITVSALSQVMQDSAR